MTLLIVYDLYIYVCVYTSLSLSLFSVSLTDDIRL